MDWGVLQLTDRGALEIAGAVPWTGVWMDCVVAHAQRTHGQDHFFCPDPVHRPKKLQASLRDDAIGRSLPHEQAPDARPPGWARPPRRHGRRARRAGSPCAAWRSRTLSGGHPGRSRPRAAALTPDASGGSGEHWSALGGSGKALEAGRRQRGPPSGTGQRTVSAVPA